MTFSNFFPLSNFFQKNSKNKGPSNPADFAKYHPYYIGLKNEKNFFDSSGNFKIFFKENFGVLNLANIRLNLMVSSARCSRLVFFIIKVKELR